jgi:hypothetical protein
MVVISQQIIRETKTDRHTDRPTGDRQTERKRERKRKNKKGGGGREKGERGREGEVVTILVSYHTTNVGQVTAEQFNRGGGGP